MSSPAPPESTTSAPGSSSAHECPICAERFNKSSRAPITCVKCDLVCCKTCFKRYIVDDAHLFLCMGCQVEFDRASLHERLGVTFLNTEFRDIRERVLYDIEKSMFPMTQGLIEQELEIDRLHKQKDQLDARYAQLRVERVGMLKEFRYSTEVKTVRAALDTYNELLTAIEVLDEQLEEERGSIQNKIDTLSGEEKHTSRRLTYVLLCPSANCKGLLSEENTNSEDDYRCSICEAVTCHRCKMVVFPGKTASAEERQAAKQARAPVHACDPGVLETVKIVESTSKPCPGCSAPIQKTSGCNQMFCTSCHVSFDWRSMRINNGAVHNPYHSAWLRANRNARSREVGDIPCGREITMSNTLDTIAVFEALIDVRGAVGTSASRGAAARSPAVRYRRRDLFPNYRNRRGTYARTRAAVESGPRLPELASHELAQYREYVEYLFESMRVAIHHHEVTLPRLAARRVDHTSPEQLRIQYLTNIISETDFKHEIQRRDKATAKRNDLLQIVTTFRDSITEIVWPFTAADPSEPQDEDTLRNWAEMVEEVRALEAYINKCFQNIARVYGTSVRSAYAIMDDRAIH